MSLSGRFAACLNRCGEVGRRFGAESQDLARRAEPGGADLDTGPRLAITVELARSQMAEAREGIGQTVPAAARRRLPVGAK